VIFHYTATACSRPTRPAPRRSRSTGCIGQRRPRQQARTTVCRTDRIRLPLRETVRIGVTGGAWTELLARLMDAQRAARTAVRAAGAARSLVRSCLDSAERAMELGLGGDRIILSAKVSAVAGPDRGLRRLATRTRIAAPGLTEAGMVPGHRRLERRVAVLLQAASGTIASPHARTQRRSLGPLKSSSRELLQTMGCAACPLVTACPGWRTHHQQLLPDTGAEHPGHLAPPHA